MKHLYKFLAICFLFPLFHSNATVSDEQPKPKFNARKALDCGIPAPNIVNYGCLKKVWDKRFGGNNNDEHIKTIKLSDGYLVVGNSGSSISGDKSENRRGNSRDYWIIKIDNDGNKLWDKTYGGTGNEFLTDAIKLSDGGFILTGQSDSGISGDKTEASKGLSDYWILKIDANGNKIWDKTYGGDNDERGAYVRETSDGLLIGGTSFSPISGNKTVTISSTVYHFWILKLDAQGNKVWEKQFGGTDNNQYVTSLEIVNSNEYLILGFSGASANTGNKTSPRKGGPDYWLVKIDSNGNKIWDQSYGGSSSDYPYSMVVANDGKITIAGSTSSTVGNGSDVSRRTDGSSNNFSDAWIVQVDSDGNKLWDKSYGTSSGERATSIVLNNQGNYIISISPSVGNKNYDLSQDSRGQDDYWIMELDANGSKLWDRSFGGTLSDNVNSIIVQNNDIIMSGISYSNIGGDKSQQSRGQEDYWLVKMNYCQSTVSSSTTICKNDSIFLTVQGCSNASTVKWNNNETGQTLSVKPSVTTTYKAICISTETGCQSDSSLAFTVNVNTTSPPPVSASNTNLCVGASTTITASGCQGTYGWTGGAATSSITVSPTVTKIYKVACTFSGCTSDSTSTTITVNPLPTRPTITTPNQNICIGGSIILLASGCNNGIYQWTGGLIGSSVTINSINVTSTYKVACKVSNCVSDSSIAVTITTVTKPAIPTITPPTNTSICQGSSVNLFATGCSGGTLGWTGGIISPSFTVVLPVGVKSYKVACTINGCTSDSSSVLTITVNPKPTKPTINQVSQTICAGQSLNLTVNPVGTNTYTWTGGLSGTSISVSPTTTRLYKVATLANGCASDSSTSVTITIQATFSSPTTTNASVCEGETLTISNGLKSTIPNCLGSSPSSITATYLGGIVGYDNGTSSGSNPTATITGMSSTITKVKVSITWLKKGGGNATSCGTAHNGGNPYHGETNFRIQGPDGTTLNLVNSNTYGGSTTSTVTTVFEDGFPTVISGVPPVTGTFSPAAALSGFNGNAPNGTWTLLPYDNGSGDPLCVSGFAVTVTTNGATIPSNITWWDAQTSGSQVSTGSEYLPVTNTLALGTYTYYAQAACTGLCPSPRIATTLTILARPNAPTITPPTNSTICQGSSISLSATGCAGTYTWTGGLTGSSVSVSPSATTNYTVTCTNGTCVSANSSAQLINVIIVSGLESLKSGSWSDPTTWSCNRVPTTTDDVIINTGHTITETSSPIIRAKTLTYRGGILQILQSTTLRLGNQ